MSSGFREIVINTQERAVSSDINRLQKFSNRDLAELLRYLLSTISAGEFDAGYGVLPNGTEAPWSAEIIGGFLVRPTTGTFSFSIDAGVLMGMVQEGAPDDSDFKYVRDAGLANGVLSFAANVSGSARIDVVECRLNPVPAIVTDNRDVFDTTTGLFTASTVTKEVAARLEYRIRQGTPGAGFPGVVANWLPLMVAMIPNAAASNNNCSFWDVRPMLEDREQVSRKLTNAVPPERDVLIAKLERSSGVSAALNGIWSASNKGRKLGGQFRSSAAGAYDGPGINVADTPNQSTSITEPIADHVFLYACTPFGLPRWARYQFGGARVPLTPKGLLVVSTVKPDNVGRPQAVIPLPASWGLNGNCAVDDAVCVTMLPARDAGNWGSFDTSNDQSHSSFGEMGEVTGNVDGGSGFEIAIPEAMWPRNVRFLWVELEATFTIPANSAYEFSEIVNVEPSSGSSFTPIAYRNTRMFTNANGSTENVIYRTFVKVQRPNYYPNTDATDLIMNWTTSPTALYGSGFALPATCRFRIYGFEM